MVRVLTKHNIINYKQKIHTVHEPSSPIWRNISRLQVDIKVQVCHSTWTTLLILRFISHLHLNKQKPQVCQHLNSSLQQNTMRVCTIHLYLLIFIVYCLCPTKNSTPFPFLPEKMLFNHRKKKKIIRIKKEKRH